MVQAAGFYFGLGIGTFEAMRMVGGQLALGAGGWVEASVEGLAMGLSAPSWERVAGVTTSRAADTNMIVVVLAVTVAIVATLLFKNRPVKLDDEGIIAK